MAKSLEFTDCLNCGKRIRTTAKKCHHCQSPQEVEAWQTDEEFWEHDAQDMLDDDEDEEPKERKLPRWIWFTAWLLLIGMLIPIFLELNALMRAD